MSEYPLAKLDQSIQEGGMSERALAKLDQARLALAECRTLPEVLKIRDLAEAFKAYVNAARLGREAQNHAAEIAILACRKAGDFLSQLERGKPGPKLPATIAGNSDYMKTLEETNTPERTAQHWQRLFRIPEEVLTKYIDETKVNNGEISAFGLLKAEPHAEKRKNRNEPETHSITFPEQKPKSIDDHTAAITEVFVQFSELNKLTRSVQRDSLSLQERGQVKTLIQTLRKISKDAGERADVLEAALDKVLAA